MGLTASSAILFLVRFGSLKLQDSHPVLRHAFVPLGVIVIDFCLAFLAIVGIRVARRLISERSDRHRSPSSREPTATILVGAGRAGVQVAREIVSHPQLGIRAVGFLDDDHMKLGTVIEGLPVLGVTSDAGKVAHITGATQAIITIAGARGSEIRRINELCTEAALRVRIVPGVSQILDGRVNVSRIRQVSIEDLLRREPVALDSARIRSFITGKRVLVTGAGGSIGSELCRQVASLEPANLVLVERAEFHLFRIHSELSENHKELEVVPRICDVCDTKRLDAVFREARPEVVFHAAAHKHVPMMEWNPGEAIKNNVFGTRKVAEAANRHGAEAFVLISTDKAVNPSSIMGTTKRVAEMVIQALSAGSRTKYVAVRFGNVLGSAGSVIPQFQAQIAKGGPVTVTHPDMVRYFMTIPEASLLVMQAAAMGQSGQVMVLDMGEPARVVDLARDLIRLSGLEPDEDIKIVFTGVRPGEKLHEEIGFDAERMGKTGHPKVFEGLLASCSWADLEPRLTRLAEYTGCADPGLARIALRELVPEMQLPDLEAAPKGNTTDPLVPPQVEGPVLEPAQSV